MDAITKMRMSAVVRNIRSHLRLGHSVPVAELARRYGVDEFVVRSLEAEERGLPIRPADPALARRPTRGDGIESGTPE